MLDARGYDADWFREALVKRANAPCIPSRKRRKVALPHDPALDIKRRRIETMFDGPEDWRRAATRDDPLC